VFSLKNGESLKLIRNSQKKKIVVTYLPHSSLQFTINPNGP